MSTFGGLIPEIDGISVDRFDGVNLKSKIFFLSHCHEDHMKGLNKSMISFLNKDSRIYVSHVSNVILKSRCPELINFITPLNVDDPTSIRIPSRWNEKENYDNISVTLIPAGHCPGSVMFLFEKPDGMRILYTGDFRVSKNQLMGLKKLHNTDGTCITIHKMYFDSTFWNESFKYFPKRTESCNFICSIIEEWISKGKDHLVSLSIPAKYGSERLFKEIADQLKMPIHVNEYAFKIYGQISEMQQTVTQNPMVTQIHSCSTNIRNIKRQITCRIQIDEKKIRHIRPSALCWKPQEIKNGLFKENEDSSFFNVCYSSHCSYDELCDFLLYLKPKKVEPCVVPRELSCDFYESLNEFTKKFGCEPCIYDIQNHVFEDSETQTDDYKNKVETVCNSSFSDSDNEICENEKCDSNPTLNWEIKSTTSVRNKKIKLFRE